MLNIKEFIIKYKIRIVLALILLLAAYFRFHGLIIQGGVINGDDESFLNIAKSFRNSFEFFKNFVANGFDTSNIRDGAKEFFSGSFRDYTFARPGYILLITIPTLFLGVQDYIPTILNAILSLITIYLVYKVTFEITGKHKIGLLASLLLTISGYSVFFARTGLSQTTAAFFLMLGLLFYFYTWNESKNTKRYLKLSALVFGFTITVHYSTFLFFGIIGIFEIVQALRKKKLKERLKILIPYALPFIILFQTLTYIKLRVFQSWNFQAKYFTYLEEIKHIYTIIPDFADRYTVNDSIFQYFKFMNVYDSIIIVSLFVLSLVLFIIKKWWRNDNYTFIFALTYIPFIVYSLIKLRISYNLATLLPLIAIVCSFGVFGLINYIKVKNIRIILGSVILVVIMFFGLKTAYTFSNFDNPYDDAANFLQSQSKEIKEICGTRNGAENVKFYLDDYSINSHLNKI